MQNPDQSGNKHDWQENIHKECRLVRIHQAAKHKVNSLCRVFKQVTESFCKSSHEEIPYSGIEENVAKNKLQNEHNNNWADLNSFLPLLAIHARPKNTIKPIIPIKYFICVSPLFVFAYNHCFLRKRKAVCLPSALNSCLRLMHFLLLR